MCRLIRVPFVSTAKFMFLFYVPVTHILHKCYICIYVTSEKLYRRQIVTCPPCPQACVMYQCMESGCV